MSLPIAATLGRILPSTGSSFASQRSMVTAGLTSTRPATSEPCTSASRSARVPPADSPQTNTLAHRDFSSANAASTVPYQSCQLVRLASFQCVP
jgi:hypothetical protein